MKVLFIYLAIWLASYCISCSTNRNKEREEKIDLIDTKPAEIRYSRYIEYDSSFAFFVRQFSSSIKTHGRKEIKSISLDSLDICESIINTDTFLSRCYSEIFDGYTTAALADDSRLEYFAYLPLNLEEVSPFARNEIINDPDILKYREIEIIPLASGKEKNRVVLSFIKTKNGYVFYRYYSVTKKGTKKCCG